MAATQTRPPVAADLDGSGAAHRTVRPRRGLPGGRAVVGGFLVAVAAVGIFAAVSGAGKGPSTRYVITARALDVGDIVEADDLRTVAIDLPAAQASRSFRDVAAVVGTVAVAPIGKGDLLQASSLGDPEQDGIPTVAVAVDGADGLSGTLRSGDRVDAYVSYGSGTESSTRLIVGNVQVVAVGSGDGTVGTGGEAQVTLAVPDEGQRISLINGVHAGAVTLVRTTGAEGEAKVGDVYVEKELNGERAGDSSTTTTAPG